MSNPPFSGIKIVVFILTVLYFCNRSVITTQNVTVGMTTYHLYSFSGILSERNKFYYNG